jgi:transcriptional regulator with XRE-family HTH domain
MFGDDIRSAREQLKLSQAELARRAGVRRSILRRVEANENVTTDTLSAIAAQLPNLKALHLGTVPLVPLTEAGHAMNESFAAAAVLLTSLSRLSDDIGGFIAAHARLAQSLEESGALRPPPPKPIGWIEPDYLSPETMEIVRQMDRDLEARNASTEDE